MSKKLSYLLKLTAYKSTVHDWYLTKKKALDFICKGFQTLVEAWAPEPDTPS